MENIFNFKVVTNKTFKYIYKHLLIMKNRPNYYEVLGLKFGETNLELIKKAYREKAKVFHPDKNSGDPERFRKITEAYEILTNLAEKQAYDLFYKNIYAPEFEKKIETPNVEKKVKKDLPEYSPTFLEDLVRLGKALKSEVLRLFNYIIVRDCLTEKVETSSDPQKRSIDIMV